VVSLMGLALTSAYGGAIPLYSRRELKVLFILLVLFVAVKGLQLSGVLSRVARTIERGGAIPAKLVLTTYLLSMLVTNDIALLVMVPLTLALDVDRKDLLVILEALAANAGSALTPFGNPQNLFIYWFYGVGTAAFIWAISPFSVVLFVMIVVFSFMVKTRNGSQEPVEVPVDGKRACAYALLFLVVLLTALGVLPLPAGGLVIVFASLFDRRALRVDYALLLTFFFFFGLAGNLKVLFASEIAHSGHIFLLTALASQIMSNVPATLLVAKFTHNWKALLWGANTGGFGSLFGSLANLIAYKVYAARCSAGERRRFTARFLAVGYGAFVVSIGLYFSLHFAGRSLLTRPVTCP